MKLTSYTGIIGGILVLAGSVSPMLHIKVVGNWNYFKIDSTLATIACVLAVLGILGAVLQKTGLQRFAGWFILVWIIFTYVAVVFKVNDYFSIIPFKRLAKWATAMITFRYTGWLGIFLGAVLMLFVKRKSVTNN